MVKERRPSVLVGLLHVGEPSVSRVRQKIRAQADVDVEVIEISHQTKWEGHRRLFHTFSSASPRHDALVKIDADMELAHPRLLHAIGQVFRSEDDLDHLIIGVDDWYSGRRIQGMNAWRRGVRWISPPPDLFTDLATNTARTKLKVIDIGRPLVLHAVDPSDEQAVRYGLQRGLKAIATGKASRIGRLREVVDYAEQEPERGRLLAVAAIGLALADPPSARSLLDAARDGGADLDGLRRWLGNPDLCTNVRSQVTQLTSAATPDTKSRETSHGQRLIGAARAAAGRVVLRRSQGEPSRREGWQNEFLALLQDP